MKLCEFELTRWWWNVLDVAGQRFIIYLLASFQPSRTKLLIFCFIISPQWSVIFSSYLSLWWPHKLSNKIWWLQEQLVSIFGNFFELALCICSMQLSPSVVEFMWVIILLSILLFNQLFIFFNIWWKCIAFDQIYNIDFAYLEYG